MLFLFQAHLCFIPCVTWKKMFSLKPRTHRKLGGRVSLLLGCCINSYWVNSIKLNLCVPGSSSPKDPLWGCPSDRRVRNLDGGGEVAAVLFWRSSGVRGSIWASRVSRMTFWSLSSLLCVLYSALLHSCQLFWIAVGPGLTPEPLLHCQEGPAASHGPCTWPLCRWNPADSNSGSQLLPDALTQNPQQARWVKAFAPTLSGPSICSYHPTVQVYIP